MMKEEPMAMVPRMTLNFIYEEAHPNYPEEMKKALQTFIKGLCEKDPMLVIRHLEWEKVNIDGELVSSETARDKIMDQLELIPETELIEIRDVQVNHNNETGEGSGSCEFEYKVNIADKGITKAVAQANLHFENSYSLANITRFSIPKWGL
jgi:hypothetical protein